jgi:hypothetical protein
MNWLHFSSRYMYCNVSPLLLYGSLLASRMLCLVILDVWSDMVLIKGSCYHKHIYLLGLRIHPSFMTALMYWCGDSCHAHILMHIHFYKH